MVYPYSERELFHGMSYGLGPASYDFRIDQDLTIPSGGFKLCSTVERVRIPNFIAARVCDKSSWARLGLVVQNTHFDPGFQGYPTIELTNHSKKTIKIKCGMPICQFVFEYLDYPTQKPYRGKYNYQPAKPVEAIYESVQRKKGRARRIYPKALSEGSTQCEIDSKKARNTKRKCDHKVSHSKRKQSRK